MIYKNRYRHASLLGGLLVMSLFVGLSFTGMAGTPVGTRYPVGMKPQSVVVGDFNLDGIPDIAVVNLLSYDLTVLLGQPGGTFRPAPGSPLRVGLFPMAVVAAAFDGSDLPTLALVSSGSNFMASLTNKTDGTFAYGQFVTVGEAPSSLVVGDFDNDNNLDILVSNSGDNTISFLRGRGNGTFDDTARSFAAGMTPIAVASGDFDEDGKLDMVFANFRVNSVGVMKGLGDGTFSLLQTITVGDGPRALAVADLNRDRHADIVVANQRARSVSVLLGRGDGTFMDVHNYDVGRSPRSLAVGDFNNDDYPDLAVVNQDDNTVSILLGLEEGGFAPPTTINLGLGSDPSAIAVADLNDDGVDDLIVANEGSDTVSVLLGNGDGTFR